jgi:exopolyphosphatase/guanosine-5'-triphosphate,3'-diphosphate pyrophosphatase
MAEPASSPSAHPGRVAVVDIGSNSIRLVVFERPSRAPVPLFNEKVLCGLGRGLDSTGRLSEVGVESALANLVRFVRLARAMGVARLDLLATAAVRDAENGRAFVAEVERRCGVAVRVLSGEDEARLSALGVVSGIPEADGLMGDLGGGSLELVALDQGALGRRATLPIGPLRLADATEGDREAARATIDRHLATVDWLPDLRGRSFYPVGGAWRTLARIHMEQNGYPLHVIHQYRIGRRQAEDLARVIGRLGKRSLTTIGGMPRRRQETLPFAAMLLERVLRLSRPDRIVFSAYGLREGHLFDGLPPAEQRKDPLVEAARELAAAEDRFGPMGDRLDAWLAPLFAEDEPEQRRLRLAICHLSDLAWREHPDYRPQYAFDRVLHLQLSAIDHPGRAAAAIAVAVRYGGGLDLPEIAPLRGLLDETQQRRAQLIGLALRLAYSLSGATPELLGRTRLSLADDALRLHLPGDGSVLSGEAVERRLETLGRALERTTAVVMR